MPTFLGTLIKFGQEFDRVFYYDPLPMTKQLFSNLFVSFDIKSLTTIVTIIK